MAAAVMAPVPPRAFDCGTAAHAGDNLEAILTATQARAAQWRLDGARALQLDLKQGAEELRRERAGLEDLRDELQSSRQLAETARRTQTEGSRMAKVLRQSADAGAKRARAAESTRDKLQEAQGARHKDLRRQEGLLAEQRRAAEAQEAEVERFLGLFRERLGLVVSRAAPRTVRLAFTLLDEEDPAREFSVTLGTDEQGYRVLECSPQVPQVDSLLERLSSSGGAPTALPAFVCGMRRAFQEVAGAAGKLKP